MKHHTGQTSWYIRSSAAFDMKNRHPLCVSCHLLYLDTISKNILASYTSQESSFSPSLPLWSPSVSLVKDKASYTEKLGPRQNYHGSPTMDRLGKDALKVTHLDSKNGSLVTLGSVYSSIMIMLRTKAILNCSIQKLKIIIFEILYLILLPVYLRGCKPVWREVI